MIHRRPRFGEQAEAFFHAPTLAIRLRQLGQSTWVYQPYPPYSP